MYWNRIARALLALSALLALPAAALNQSEFEESVHVETLDNGLTVIVYERPTAPVVSFYTYVDVGSAQEVPGITGLAHMFEHMAFKGTTKIGTTDYKKEQRALQAVDLAYAALERERRKPTGSDPELVEVLERAFEEAQQEAQGFVVSNEFVDIIDRAGGTGLNASTGADRTDYFYSLPANKVELWAYLESERFLDPVFREFYMERDVVQEERRMRTDSQPIGRMVEQLLTTAFMAHPYGSPTVGYMSDLQTFTRDDARVFYEKYYTPSNMTVAIVGDVKTKDVVSMVKKYFGRMQARPKPEPLRTVEPKQIAEKVIRIPDASQPVYAEAYHRPAANHPDDAVYDAISDILSNGRTSRLYRRMVRDEKTAAAAGAMSGLPGEKYPNLMIFFGLPTPGNDNETIQTSIRDEIERLKNEPVSAEELKMVKTRAKANLIRGLDNNMGIAIQLAQNQALWGDWRELFKTVERIEAVTAADIQRVAKSTFRPNNRTVAMIVNDDASN